MKDYSLKNAVSQLTQRQKLAAMRAAPLFSALSDHDLAGLLAACLTRLCGQGQMIFTSSETADKFYVVLAGRVKVYKLSPRGDEQILHLYGPGETFGEAAMWSQVHYPAHAQAIEESTLLIVPRRTLRQAIAGNTDLAIGMFVGLSGKLREFNQLIEQLSLKDVPSRIAMAFLTQAHKAGSRTFRLSQTKRELAGQIGTVPETLSRGLAKLRAERLIEVKGAEVTILDEDGLRAVAEGE